LESTKKDWVATHFFQIISLESLLKKEGKDISSQVSFEISFTNRKANTFIKVLKLHGK